MTNRLHNLILLAVLVAGLALRIAVVLHHGPAPRHDLFPGMDEVNYHELAENLRTTGSFAAWTGGFLTRSTRSPGYPAMLAAALLPTRNHPWAAQLLNLVFDTLNLLLIFLIARKMYGNVAAGVAAGLYAVYGPVFLYLPLATPEMMSICLVLLVCLCLGHLRDSYWRVAPALGILYALLIHTRPVFLLLTPVLAVCVWLQLPAGTWRTRLPKSFFPAALVLFLCIPWGVRNYRLHRAVVPVCVTAGWHLVNRAQTVDDLSVGFLTDYIYAPNHAEFTEGDYYREGMTLSRELFLREPFRVLYFGCLRVIHGWFLPQSPFRFLLPRAYVWPVFFGDRFFIPVPDGEGLLYLGIALTLFGFSYFGFRISRPGFKEVFRAWFGPGRALVVLLVAYAGVHVIGFPLIQYRFIVEPVLLILGVGWMTGCLAAWRDGIRGSASSAVDAATPAAPALPTTRSCEFRGAENLPLVCSAIFVAAVLVAWGWRTERPSIQYPEIALPHGHIDYPEARRRQWLDRGNLPKGTQAVLAGVLKYARPNLSFPADKAVAVPDDDYTAAMLYINYGNALATGFPDELGLGDCKLNIRGKTTLRDGDAILVRGTLKTGAYKDLILDVEAWQPF